MMARVHKGSIPGGSLIEGYLPADYSDVFKSTVINDKSFSPDDIMVKFWTFQPKWLDYLFRFRNILVKPFGLSTGKVNMGKFADIIRSGGQEGMMSVPSKTPEETILELKDKHLNAILSVHIKEEKNGWDIIRIISITTLVNFHNKLGITYFFMIKPFHKFIVKAMMKNIIRSFE